MTFFTRTFWALTAIAIALTLAAPSPAHAKKKKKVAIVPFATRGDPDQATVDAVYGLLSKASALVDGVEVIAGDALEKKVKKPAATLEACGSDLKCIANIGKKVKAEEILIGRASAKDGAVDIAFITLATKNAGLVRKLNLTFASAADAKNVLGGAFFEIFGFTDPGKVKIIGAKGKVFEGDKYIGKGPGPHKIKPGRHELVVDGRKLVVMLPPKQTKILKLSDGEPVGETPPALAAAPAAAPADDPLADLPLVPPTPAGTPVAAASPSTTAATAESSTAPASEAATPPPAGDDWTIPGEAVATAPPPAPSDNTPFLDRTVLGFRPLTIAGAGVAVVGLALVGVGGYFAGHASSLQGAINPQTFTHTAALAQNEAAFAAEDTSVAFFIAGGVLAAAGATLATVDMFVLQKPTTRITVSSGGSSVWLRVDF